MFSFYKSVFSDVYFGWFLISSLLDDAGNRLRFQLELEFVQCLANPNYLNFLAQRGYFKDKAFVNYLKYLLYWKEPEYAKYLKYPQCLHMLELLQYEHFRKELVNAQCAKFIDEQQILHWQHYSRKRMRLQQALAEQQQQNNTSGKWKADPDQALTTCIYCFCTWRQKKTLAPNLYCDSTQNR